MATDFVEKDDNEFGEQLHDHGEALDTHGAALDFSASEITAAKNDAAFFLYLLGRQSVTQAFAQEVTDFKNLARKGSGSAVLPAAIPELGANPLPLPTAVAEKIEMRFRQRAAKAKAHPAYTHGIGEALKIEKPATVFDPNNGSPLLKIDLTHAGHPHIKFKKGNWQGAEIWKLTAIGGGSGPGPNPSPDDPAWTKLERVFGHDYIDPAELPGFGQSVIWAYKAIYLFKNEQVGNWGNIVLVTLGGH